MSAANLVHALSFDIEDWFHIIGVRELEDRESWAARPSLVERYTDEILELCDGADVRGTFFVLGWIAEHYPHVVARIADAGHEIGTHSFWHGLVTDQTRDEFTIDLVRSIEAVEQAAGTSVKGYRAPSFSIRPGTEWALEVLLDSGIEFDASLYPAKRMNGGYSVERGPHRFALPSGRSIPELPMSVLPLGVISTGFSGGGYLRLMPLPLVRWGMDSLARRSQPTILYMHPRDFAPDSPRAPMPVHRKFMTHIGTKKAREKVGHLLQQYDWAPCGQVLEPLMDR